jgi:hypothetical protein
MGQAAQTTPGTFRVAVLVAAQEMEAYPFREHPQAVPIPSEPYHFNDRDRKDFVEIGIPIESVRLVDGVLLSWWLSRTVKALEHFRLIRLTLNPLSLRLRSWR